MATKSTDEEALVGAARAKAQALAALARPTARPRGPKHDYGDGDPCPTFPGHGRMYVLPSNRQYCAHHAHDRDRTRAFWPLHDLEAEMMPPQPILPDITGDITW